MSENIGYRILCTKGAHKGKYASGGKRAKFNTNGKIWFKHSHVLSHMSDVDRQTIAQYITSGAIVEEVELSTLKTSEVSEYYTLLEKHICESELKNFFLFGNTKSRVIMAILKNDFSEMPDVLKTWNRKAPGFDLSSLVEFIPHHCREESIAEWSAHNGYSGIPDSTKAMLTLEYAQPGNMIFDLITKYEHSLIGSNDDLSSLF